MADFLAAQPFILQNEGGYTHIDGDTYRGITRRFFPGWQGWTIIDAHLPLKEGELIPGGELNNLVNTFYKQQFWDHILGDDINSQPIATYCYDWYVNAEHNAVKNIQALLNIPRDGVFGAITLHALNAAGDILQALHDKRIAYYTAIALGDKAQYLNGWLNRANGMYEKLSGRQEK